MCGRYALYDIYLRDNSNFDEYTMHWTKKNLIDKDSLKDGLDVKNELDMSLCKIPTANSKGEGLNLNKV